MEPIVRTDHYREVAMSDPDFKSNVHARIRSVIRAMQDGCVDCLEKRGLCDWHKFEAMRLHVTPAIHLERMEAEYSAKGNE